MGLGGLVSPSLNVNPKSHNYTSGSPTQRLPPTAAIQIISLFSALPSCASLGLKMRKQIKQVHDRSLAPEQRATDKKSITQRIYGAVCHLGGGSHVNRFGWLGLW